MSKSKSLECSVCYSSIDSRNGFMKAYSGKRVFHSDRNVCIRNLRRLVKKAEAKLLDIESHSRT